MFRKSHDIYKGLFIAAAPGTHATVAKIINEHLQPAARIIEFGAYKGAMLSRLKDFGYQNLMAADLDNHLSINGINHIKCDFNENFSTSFTGEKFDCIVAVEVIEHLNDIRHFLSECCQLLNENGYIVISTPNVGFFEGRVKFFMQGELWGFGPNNYVSQRHISPLTVATFPLILEEKGYELVKMITDASFATFLRKIVTSPIWIPMRLLFGKHVLGESLICVARRKEVVGVSRLSSKATWGIKNDNEF